MMLHLYEWQEKCLDLWLQNGGRGIVNVVTGAGKTALAIAAVSKLDEKESGLKIKIVVPKAFLVRQWARALREYLQVSREDIGVYFGTRKDSSDRRFMIYVINSARYSLARHVLEDFKDSRPVLLIADECHHYGTEENSKIFDFYKFMTTNNRFYSLGLSATPYGAHYEDVLAPRLGEEIFRFTFNNALHANIISRFAVFHICLQFDNDERADYEDISNQIRKSLHRLKKICPQLYTHDSRAFFNTLNQIAITHKNPDAVELARAVTMLSFQRKELVYLAKSRVPCVISLLRLINKKAKIIIFGERIETADEIYGLLNRIWPNEAGVYHSGLHRDVGEAALKRFDDGEIRILVSCRTLDEGLSITGADVGIIVSSTNSNRQRVQRLGRILRKKNDDRIACFYYLYVNNTTEESDILRSHAGDLEKLVTVIDLIYNETLESFANIFYDRLTASVISRVTAKGWRAAELSELLRNIKKGLVTCDWWLPEEQCLNKLRNARDKTTRNYYAAMLYLIRERQGFPKDV